MRRKPCRDKLSRPCPGTPQSGTAIVTSKCGPVKHFPSRGGHPAIGAVPCPVEPVVGYCFRRGVRPLGRFRRNSRRSMAFRQFCGGSEDFPGSEPGRHTESQATPGAPGTPCYLSDTKSFPMPASLPASGPVSKTTWTMYSPGPPLGTRHECEQKPPHEKPVMPRLMILRSDDRRKISAEPSAGRAAPSAPTVQADK